MQITSIELKKEQITYPTLPLAIYRELAAHLEQIDGVKTELLPQVSQVFDYYESQVGGVLICYPIDFKYQQRLEEILSYYACRYGSYERHLLDT